MKIHFKRLAASYGVAIVALGFLLASGRLSARDLAIASDGYAWFGAGFLLVFSSLVVTFGRYWILMRAIGLEMGLAEALGLGFASAFASLFVGVGGDLVRAMYVARRSGEHERAVASVVVDRGIGLLGLLLLGSLSFAAWARNLAEQPWLENVAVAIVGGLGGAACGGLLSVLALARSRSAALAVCGVLAALLLRDPWSMPSRLHLTAWAALGVGLLCVLVVPACQPGCRLEQVVRRAGRAGAALMSFIQSLLAYRDCVPAVLAALVLSLGSHSLAVIGIFCLGRSLPLAAPPPLASVLMAAPPALIANALAVVGGGLGVGEVAFDRLLDVCSGSAHAQGGAAILLVLRAVTLILTLLGLPLYSLFRPAPAARENPPDQTPQH